MRTLLRIMALAPLVLSSVGPATSGAATIGNTPSDVVSSMAGHWRCTSSNGAVTQRSYVVTDGGPVMSRAATSAGARAVGGARSSVDTPGAAGSAAAVARSVYGRQDGMDTGPVFERITERADHSMVAETAEGSTSASSIEASSIRFAGQQSIARVAPVNENATTGVDAVYRATASTLAPIVSQLSLSYTVEPGGLRRIMRSGSTTLSDDRCTRVREVAASTACANANAPVATAHAVAPRSVSGISQGAVQMRLVVDDLGQVVGHDVLSSTSPALTQAAIAAARDSTFTAAVQNCRAVSSQHSFAVQFTPDALRAPLSNGRETNL
jgi:hypothetical protein